MAEVELIIAAAPGHPLLEASARAGGGAGERAAW